MKLRSGFVKHLHFYTESNILCSKCNKYYGAKKFRWNCSYCFGNKTEFTEFPWRNSVFREKVNQWAKSEIEKTPSQYIRLIKQSIKIDSNPQSQNFNNTKYLIKQIKKIINDNKNATNETLWISAEKGEELLRRTGKDCDEKSHIICPLVLDWWNMKHYNYRGYELCYYGHFGDESDFEEKIKSIPPPLPYNHFT